MGSRANIVALLAFGIILGFAVGPAEGLCLYTERDWIDKGLDLVYDNGGSVIEVGSIGGISARCYSDEEKIGFVVVTVVLGILLLSVLSCIINCCASPSRRSSSIVVVRRVNPKMTV